MKKGKKKAPPRSTKNISKKRSRSTELSGVICLFIGLFFLVTLISYSAMDPSWANAASEGQKINNWGGRAGAWIAEALLQGFGVTAFILTFTLFYMGIYLVRPKEETKILVRTAGILLLTVILSSLLAVIFTEIPWGGGRLPAGGLVGHLCASFLTGTFNHLGSILILLIALFLFVLFTTRLSVRKIMLALSRIFRFSFRSVRIKVTTYQKTKNREKMREKVMKKHLSPAEDARPAKKTVLKQGKARVKKAPAPHPLPIKPPAQEPLPFPKPDTKSGYQYPPVDLLTKGKPAEKIDKNELLEKKSLIEEKLMQFGVTGEVRQYHPGPILTTYEFFPDAGIKVSQVANRSEEVSLALAATSVRIRRIPGKSSLGIEVPNNHKELIRIRDVIESTEFLNAESRLTYALGKTIHGELYITDLTKMPHLLVAGATGTGKSVALNSLIASILYKANPDEVKMILIDPKRIELSIYEGIPHLMCPVLKDARKAEAVLNDAIRKMEERYRKLGYFNVRDIAQYNDMVAKIRGDKRRKLTEEEDEQLQHMPYIVIIIDELAELMMLGAKEVNYCISRLAQLARAVGIHLIMATQRPSTDVITGTIKGNFSSRIAFRVPTKVDSRVIIDTVGAEKLLGDGDMLFIPPKNPRITRLHGSFISPSEVSRLIRFVKEQGSPEYDQTLVDVVKKPLSVIEEEEEMDRDPLFEKAVELVLATEQASASYLQRRMKLGYARAARIIDQMEHEGIVGPSEGSKAREILVDAKSYRNKIMGEDF